MKQRIFAVLAVLFLCAGIGRGAAYAVEPESSTAAVSQEARQDLAEQIRQICRQNGVTGMGLVVFDKDGICYQQYEGFAVAETGRRVTEDTKFRVASVSKSITAMLALDLVGQGRLELDAPLLPMGGCMLENPRYASQPVTLRHLLTHTSGLVDAPSYTDAIGQRVLPPLRTVLPACWSQAAPGSAYCYSNLGMGLVSGVVEQAAGEHFRTYARTKIFEPMGMDAAYSYSDLTNRQLVADIYSGGERTVFMPAWENMNAKYDPLPVGELYALGQGDLFIAPRDLARFAQVLAGCPKPDEVFSLPENLLRQMQTPQYTVNCSAEDYPCEIVRGLGTQITEYLVTGRQMVGHQGNAYGTICGMFTDPREHTGFVLLTNGAGMRTNQAGIYLVNQQTAQAVYDTFFPLQQEN